MIKFTSSSLRLFSDWLRTFSDWEVTLTCQANYDGDRPHECSISTAFPSGDVSGYAHCPKESRIHDCSEYSEYYNVWVIMSLNMYVVVRLIMSLVLLCLVLSSRFTLNTHVIKMSPGD